MMKRTELNQKILEAAIELANKAEPANKYGSRINLPMTLTEIPGSRFATAVITEQRLVFTGPIEQGPVRVIEQDKFYWQPYGSLGYLGSVTTTLSTLKSDPPTMIESSFTTPVPSTTKQETNYEEQNQSARIYFNGVYDISVPLFDDLLVRLHNGQKIVNVISFNSNAFDTPDLRAYLIRIGVRPEPDPTRTYPAKSWIVG